MEERTTWTPTQIAALRAWEARRRAGLTLDQATERLAPYLAKPWATRANLSAIEAQRLPHDTRRRDIDADLIVAMSFAYSRSPLAFFFPPPAAKRVVIGNGLVRLPDELRIYCLSIAAEDMRSAALETFGEDLMKEQLSKFDAVTDQLGLPDTGDNEKHIERLERELRLLKAKRRPQHKEDEMINHG